MSNERKEQHIDFLVHWDEDEDLTRTTYYGIRNFMAKCFGTNLPHFDELTESQVSYVSDIPRQLQYVLWAEQNKKENAAR